ncbi:MAG: methionyl-tRNA formyltransferase [Treponema sp. CETP13]|nr:MAG: methionyl-tRNA formyltransferase [Treponema sp. CETP13]
MLKVIYAGSPEISATVLKYLASVSSIEIVGVLTNPPSAKGRHKKLTPTPTAQMATSLNLTVLEPEYLRASARELISALNPDILVCFSYGKIFGPKFMELFPKGGINLHPSLLPRWRGCAPVAAAILAQDTETGISVQRVAQEMDTGDILLQTRFPLLGTETAASLLEDTAQKGGPMLASVLEQIEAGTEKSFRQSSSGSTYSEMLKKEDGAIDWKKSASEISAKIRAFNPWPGAFTCINGKMLRMHYAQVFNGNICEVCENLLQDATPGTVLCANKKNGILIQCGRGILSVTSLQWQSKKAMSWKEFLNGAHNFAGSCCCEIEKDKK